MLFPFKEKSYLTMQLENTYMKNILHKIYYMNKFVLKCYKKFIQNFIGDQRFVKS